MFHVKQLIEAALFDFNGTLYQDADINEITWRQTVEEFSEGKLNFDEIYGEYRGTKDSAFIKILCDKMGKTMTDEEIDEWSEIKEQKYRQYCIDHHRDKMTEGAEKVLDFCKENNIPINLATASIKGNVDFYFKNVDLGRWFDRELVAYDTGEFADKVSMYRECARRIGVDIKNCIVFEDSPKSVKEAIEAGCPKIIRITTDKESVYPEIRQNIKDFTELDYSIFEVDCK